MYVCLNRSEEHIEEEKVEETKSSTKTTTKQKKVGKGGKSKEEVHHAYRLLVIGK